MKFIVSFALLLLPFWSLSKDGFYTDINSMIESEIKALNKYWSLNTKLILTSEGNIRATPHNEIVVNSQALLEYQSANNKAYFQYVIRLVLAHELAHTLQFNEYPINDIILSTSEMRRVYECQADILASKYLAETLTDTISKLVDKDKSTEFTRNIYNTALIFLHDIGEDGYSGTDHPYKEQRRLALKVGAKAGAIFIMHKFFKEYYTSLTEFDRKEFLRLIPKQGALIDFDLDKDVVIWSMNMAKLIMHYSNAMSKNISCKVKNISWDKDRQIGKYNFVLKNKGSETIHINFIVRIDATSNLFPNNTLYTEIINAKTYHYSLRPNDSIEVDDYLSYLLSYDDGGLHKNFGSSIILPTNPNSFISFNTDETFTRKKVDDVKYLALSSADLFQQVNNDSNFLVVFEDVRSSALTFFDNIAVGMEKISQIGVYSQSEYDCFSPYSNVHLYIDRSSKYVEFLVYKGPDVSKAKDIYKNVNKFIHQGYSDKFSTGEAKELSDGDEDTKNYVFQLSTVSLSVSLRKFFDTVDSSYVVEIKFSIK